MIENLGSLIFLLAVFAGLVLFLVVLLFRKERFIPRITVKDGRLQVYRFLRNKVISSKRIKKISMVYSNDYYNNDDIDGDLLTFQFELTNGKVLVLREYLNEFDPIEDVKNYIINKKVPALSVRQLKEIIGNNPKIKLDKYTEIYMEKGNADDFLKSRQV